MQNLILTTPIPSWLMLVAFVAGVLIVLYFGLRPSEKLTTEQLKEIYREDNHEEAEIAAEVIETIEENETKTQEKVQELIEEVKELKKEVREELDIPPATGTREDFILHVLLKNTRKNAIKIIMNRYDYTEKLADGMITTVILEKRLKWDVKTMSYTRTEA